MTPDAQLALWAAKHADDPASLDAALAELTRRLDALSHKHGDTTRQRKRNLAAFIELVTALPR